MQPPPPTASENGFELCTVQLFTNLIPMTMQVQIRHVGGNEVSLDDCARFSEQISDVLETSQLIKGAYVLEISSPGISEHLMSDRDFQTFKGFPVEVTYLDDNNLKLSKTGLLHKRSSHHLQLNIKGRMNSIPRENVIEVRLTSPKC